MAGYDHFETDRWATDGLGQETDMPDAQPALRARFTSMTRVLPIPVAIVVHGATYAVGTALILRALALVCGVHFDDVLPTVVMSISGLAGMVGSIGYAVVIYEEHDRQGRYR